MLFGTSGIRGIFPAAITPNLALMVGQALAAYGSRTVFVGHDHRTSSPLLAAALSAGAASVGADVFELGLCPTPLIAWTCSRMGKGNRSAAIVTASHNPPEYNGIKLHEESGAGFGQEESEKIEKLMSSQVKACSWDRVGQIRPIDGVKPYIEAVAKKAGSISARVVIDCNHGTAGVVSPGLLSELDCRATFMRENPDGFWRPAASPNLEQLGDWANIAELSSLSEKIKQTNSELGIVHDGDADRVFIMLGDRPIVPDILIAAFAKIRRQTAVVSVDASMLVDEMTKTVRVPVGDVSISQTLAGMTNAFGAEPSGTFIFPEHSLCPDGIYSSVQILEYWDRLRPILNELRPYPMARTRVAVKDKEKVMKLVEKNAEDFSKKSIVDGVRVDLDYGWFLIRPSGTEPVIRIQAEARTKQGLDAALQQAKELIEKK